MSSALPTTSISLSTESTTLQSQSKDFETAFGNLSSSYGLHGTPSPTVNVTLQGRSTPLLTSSRFAFTSRSWFSTSTLKKPSPIASANTIPIVPLGLHSSISSEATIVQPSAVHKAKRDYEAAFGALSSTYGIGGHTPTLPPRSDRASAHAGRKFAGFFRTRKSTAKSQQAEGTFNCGKPKDTYRAAFGDLSSLYGTGGIVPSVPSKRMKLSNSKDKAYQSLPHTEASSELSDENAFPGKDYSAAFGSLAGSYGLHGCAQVPSMNGASEL